MDAKRESWVRNEAARCLLCHDAPCSAACPHGVDPARAIRAARFENPTALLGKNVCAACAAPCEKACLHQDFPIRVKRLHTEMATSGKPCRHADLAGDFCGVRSLNPFFLGSSVIASSYEMCARAFAAGWGGAVFKTICLMPLQEVSPRFDSLGKEGTPFIGFRNMEQLYDRPVQNALDDMARLKKDFPDRVVVASIMGRTPAEWTELAAMATAAGVDMIECNFSCPNMKDGGLGSAIGCLPDAVEECAAAALRGAGVPVIAKMTPNVTDMVQPALAAIRAGAAGLAAINTVKSLTNVLDGDKLVAGRTAVSGYSGKAVKPIALRFVAELKSCPELRGVGLSGIGGIETWRDAAEFFALGCDNVQVTTAVMQYGYRIIDDLLDGLARFLAEKGYASLREFVGTHRDVAAAADALDRESVTYPVVNRELCLECGRCYVSCRDGGHRAIGLRGRTPVIDLKTCVGCHLCSLVCPAGAIGKSKRTRR